MKKFNKVLVLIFVMIFATLMLVSCGTPDGETLKKKYEDNGYYVFYCEGDEVEKRDADADDAIYLLIATKDILGKNPQTVTVIAFKDSDTMKKYTDTQTYKNAKDAAEKENWVIKTSGNAIIIGTKDAAVLV